MPFTIAQAARVLQLAETGLLTSEQFARISRSVRLHPDPVTWRLGMQRFCRYGGILFFAVGAICFFAYNWSELHRFVKIALAVGALAACAVGAALQPPFGAGWRAALLGASLGTGILLALIGQIYQTGADMWELFRNWAVMIIPFALLARSSATWGLWLVVANIGLIRLLSQSSGSFSAFFSLFESASLAIIAAFNFMVLVCLEFTARRLLIEPRRWLHRLAAIGALTPIALGACIGWWEKPGYLGLQSGFFIGAAAALWFYRWRRFDIVMLAMICASAVAVLTVGLAYAGNDVNHSFLFLNAIGLFIVVASGGCALWLIRLYKRRQPAVTTAGNSTQNFKAAAAGAEEPADSFLLAQDLISAQQNAAWQQRHETPWWLNVLLAVAAWIAALCIFGSFFTSLRFTGDALGVRLTGGIVLLAIAIALFKGRKHVFLSQMALAFSLAGQTLTIASLSEMIREAGYAPPWGYYSGAAIAAAMLLIPATQLHRVVCALLAVGCLLVPMMAYSSNEGFEIFAGLALLLAGVGVRLANPGVAMLLAPAAVALWLSRERWAAGRYASLLKALAHAFTIMALMVARYVNLHAGPGAEGFFDADALNRLNTTSLWWYATAAIAVLLGTIVWLTRSLTVGRRVMVSAVAMICAAVVIHAPGLSICAAVALAAFHACHRPWTAIALVAGLWMLGEYYYALHTSLLFKSITLILIGALLMLLTLPLKNWRISGDEKDE